MAHTSSICNTNVVSVTKSAQPAANVHHLATSVVGTSATSALSFTPPANLQKRHTMCLEAHKQSLLL